MLQFFKKGKDDGETPKLSRADRKILDEVERKFYEEKYLKDHKINITVKDGVVTLDGLVTSPLLQDLAEQIVMDIPGVQRVQNNLNMGIGVAGHDTVTLQDQPSDDIAITEASNTGDANIHHPTTTAFSEVRSQTREDVTGGIDTGITADEAAQMAIPETGEGSSVMDAGAADAIKVSGTETDEDILEQVLREGIQVVDREGKAVGKVKEVRSTDFLMKRTLKRDLYVPYFNCKYDGQHVILKVLASEVDHQGWAFPKPF